MKIAFRVKGYGKVVEGTLVESSNKGVFVETTDGTFVGGPADVIEAIWFLGRWMSAEQFESLQ